MAKTPTSRIALYAGLILVALWAVRQLSKPRAVSYDDVTPLPAAPGSEFPTVENPFACNARTLQQFPLRSPPFQPLPGGSEWRGCWPGYHAAGTDTGGATSCRNMYNGKTAPPQKFRRTGDKWYGCTFSVDKELWECPTCER